MLQGPRSWALYLLLDGRFVPGSSFLAFKLLALQVLGALGALGSLGNSRPLRGLRLPRLVACRELWLGILIKVLREKVCAVIEDILLSECDDGGKSKGNGRAPRT
jgi:hypothetical protein